MYNPAIGLNPTMLSSPESWWLYLTTIATYLPGIYFIAKNRWALKFPVIALFFIGMFALQALGSILIFISPSVYSGTLAPFATYILIIAIQPLILYFCIYFFWKQGWIYQIGGLISQSNQKFDIHQIERFCILACSLMIIIICIYFVNVGEFAVFRLIDGRLHHTTAGIIRGDLIYGQRHYPFYRFGFVVFPILTASAAAIVISENGLARSKKMAAILLTAFAAPLLNAEKTGVLTVAFCFAVSTLYYNLSKIEIPPLKFKFSYILIALGMLTPTLIIVHLYYGDELGLLGKIEVILFRIFGSYTQATAASIRIAQNEGFFNGLTLPTIHGLLPHTQILLEDRLHLFITGWKGSVPASSAAEGYVNFGWPGFLIFSFSASISVIFIQNLLLKIGNFGKIIQPFYAYLALMLSATGFFQTIGSLTTTVALTLIYLLYRAICDLPVSCRSSH